MYIGTFVATQLLAPCMLTYIEYQIRPLISGAVAHGTWSLPRPQPPSLFLRATLKSWELRLLNHCKHGVQ